MILDKTWNRKEQKLTISYIDKLGNRQFYSKYLHHIKTYEYDEDGEFETWDGKRCNKVYKDTSNYIPNEFDILEFMYELPKDLLDVFHTPNFSKIYTFDIETEISDEFPDPFVAKQKVTSISLCGPDMSCIVYGLHKMSDESIQLFRQRYLEWIDNNDFAKNLKKTTPKVLYQYFESEEEMLKHFFTVILPKVPILAGWNSYNFDYNYLWHRLCNLFGDREARNMIYKASPTREISKIGWADMSGNKYSAPAPAHSIVIDYMDLVQSYDYSLRPYESYGLDYVGSRAVNAHKIKYEGTLQDLYERDHEWYYFYNAIDSLIVLLIHYRLRCIEAPSASSSVTLVTLLDAMGQIKLTTANVFSEFYTDNKHVVWDWDRVVRQKIPYDGAFCGCVPGRYEWTVCDDFASLYPSQVQTCNLSFENFIENKVGPDSFGRYVNIGWSEEQLEEFRKDPNYFVSVNGNVYKNDKDYAFKRMQRRVKKNRDYYKYTGQKIESEILFEVDRLIKEKESA